MSLADFTNTSLTFPSSGFVYKKRKHKHCNITSHKSGSIPERTAPCDVVLAGGGHGGRSVLGRPAMGPPGVLPVGGSWPLGCALPEGAYARG